MANILYVNACVRANSRTNDLAKYILNKLNGDVEEIKLYEKDISPLDLSKQDLRDKAHINNDFSDKEFDLAKQFSSAETIVISAPYWDLSFPSVLKTYFENVTVTGLTFSYDNTGRPVGICKAKKLIYVTTSGGPIYHNFGYDYVSTLAKVFYGIKEVDFISAEGLDIYGANVKQIIDNTKQLIDTKY